MESNHRPDAYEATALPLSYAGKSYSLASLDPLFYLIGLPTNTARRQNYSPGEISLDFHSPDSDPTQANFIYYFFRIQDFFFLGHNNLAVL